MSEFEKVLDEYNKQTKPMCEALDCLDLLDDFLVDIELSRAKYHHFYQAGEQSQQAKIDSLQKESDRLNTWYKNVKLQFENKQIDCDRSDRKIDELSRKVESNLEINKNLQNMIEELIDERDELQARIDEAVDYVAESGGVSPTSEIALNNILKGNKDD